MLGQTVILVDADRPRRNEVAVSFRLAGCRVIEVSSPLELFNTLDRGVRDPDAIVISGSGEPPVEYLRRHLTDAHPLVPTVVLSDHFARPAL